MPTTATQAMAAAMAATRSRSVIGFTGVGIVSDRLTGWFAERVRRPSIPRPRAGRGLSPLVGGEARRRPKVRGSAEGAHPASPLTATSASPRFPFARRGANGPLPAGGARGCPRSNFKSAALRNASSSHDPEKPASPACFTAPTPAERLENAVEPEEKVTKSPLAAAVALVMEGDRPVGGEVDGDLRLEFVEDRAGDVGQVELACRGEVDPGELGELGVRGDPAGSSAATAVRSTAKKRVSKRRTRLGGVIARATRCSASRSGRTPWAWNASQPSGASSGGPYSLVPSRRPVSS